MCNGGKRRDRELNCELNREAGEHGDNWEEITINTFTWAIYVLNSGFLFM